MEWHGMVWCGLVWNDTEVYGMVRHGTLRYLVVWLWRGAARHGLGDSVAWHPTAWSGERGAGSGDRETGRVGVGMLVFDGPCLVPRDS